MATAKKNTKGARAAHVVEVGMKSALDKIRKAAPRVSEARVREIARLMEMADDEFPRVVVTQKEFDKIYKEAFKNPTRQKVYYIVAD